MCLCMSLTEQLEWLYIHLFVILLNLNLLVTCMYSDQVQMWGMFKLVLVVDPFMIMIKQLFLEWQQLMTELYKHNINPVILNIAKIPVLSKQMFPRFDTRSIDFICGVVQHCEIGSTVLINASYVTPVYLVYICEQSRLKWKKKMTQLVVALYTHFKVISNIDWLILFTAEACMYFAPH